MSINIAIIMASSYKGSGDSLKYHAKKIVDLMINTRHPGASHAADRKISMSTHRGGVKEMAAVHAMVIVSATSDGSISNEDRIARQNAINNGLHAIYPMLRFGTMLSFNLNENALGTPRIVTSFDHDDAFKDEYSKLITSLCEQRRRDFGEEVPRIAS